MGKKYAVTLTADERGQLDALLRKGKASALVLTRTRILLKADAGPCPFGRGRVVDVPGGVVRPGYSALGTGRRSVS